MSGFWYSLSEGSGQLPGAIWQGRYVMCHGSYLLEVSGEWAGNAHFPGVVRGSLSVFGGGDQASSPGCLLPEERARRQQSAFPLRAQA